MAGMHIRRLLPILVVLLLLLVVLPDRAVALLPADGGTGPRAALPTGRAPDVASADAGAPGAAHAPGAPGASGARLDPRARWQWPLDPRPPVLRRYLPPASAWGPGHRGVDLGATVGAAVLAVADGTVSHVGVIAGKPTVSVLHTDGVRSTYEPVVASVRRGDDVTAGQRIGTVAAAGSHCASACVHLGARRGAAYLDPLLLLGSWRVRLLPLHGPPVAVF